jgi:phenylacetate-CoA ligase
MIRHAYDTSPFYHEKFREANVKPGDIRTVEDLKRLPVTRKEEMIKKLDKVVSDKFDVAGLKSTRTSGSTGKPLVIYISQGEDEFRKAKHLRAQIALGQRPWHRWVTITSPLHFAETTRLQRALGLYGIHPVSVFDDVGTQVTKIEKLRPDVLDGYSNSLLLLAKEIKKRGLHDITPEFVVSGAELIDSGSRRFVEEVFGVPFYDQYGSNEFERLAWQCKEKKEYHMDADSVIMQFIDDNGEEVARGEQGEVVCTSLFNYAMPFIKYGLDDIGVLSDNDTCDCGRTLPLMKILEGRKTSLLSFPSGRVIAPFAFMLAVWNFKYYDAIDMFRVVQKAKDTIIFRLRLKEGVGDEGLIRKELEKHIRGILNLGQQDVDIEVEFVDEIPLDKTGKFRIVVSELEEP